MQVGAIGGGMAMGAAGAAGSASATGASAGGTAAAGSAGQGIAETQTAGSQSARPWESVAEMGLEALGDSIKDFNSIDLLIALLLMAAMQGKDDDDKSSGGSSALGFLAGLALASQLGQAHSHDMQAPVQEISGGDVGGNINLTA